MHSSLRRRRGTDSAFPGSVQIHNIQAEMSTAAPTTAPAAVPPSPKSAPPKSAATPASPPKPSASAPPPSSPSPSRTPAASPPSLSSPPSSSSPPIAGTPPSAASPPSSSSPGSPHLPAPAPPAHKPSHHARPPPPPPHGSSHSPPSSSDGGLSTPLIIVIAAAGALAVLALVVLIACCRKKKRPHPPIQYYGDPPHPYKDDYNGGRLQQWQQTPPPMDYIGKVPLPHPPPAAIAVRHSSSPPAYLPPPPPPPPLGGMSSEEYSSSGFSGSRRVLLPPPSPGLSLGFSKGMFTYEELEAATNGFSQANLLGQGGFGYVYKGTLPGGQLVAVKRLKAGGGQGEREFQAEVEIISRVHHRHLVSLVGYCIAGSQRILVYEFVSNNTLDYHLHGKGRPSMDWPTRLKIALGAARGLAYLHEDCYPRIIHRDIKSSNILLDDNFEAKVADFGLAKLASDGFTHVSTRVMGTFGYLAPEYASSGKLTEKSDVFSFGVMLLELITGRRPVDATESYLEDSLVEWARPLLARALEDGSMDSLVDPRLQNSYNMNEMTQVIASAAACVRHSARRRPRMGQIVRALEGDVLLSTLNDGMRPGHSTVYGSHESSDYDSGQYSEDMKKFRKMALGSQEFGSEYSGHTSEYGLNPSVSSSEFHNSKDMEFSTGRSYLPRQTGNRKNHMGMISEYLYSKERKTPPDLSSKFASQ